MAGGMVVLSSIAVNSEVSLFIFKWDSAEFKVDRDGICIKVYKWVLARRRFTKGREVRRDKYLHLDFPAFEEATFVLGKKNLGGTCHFSCCRPGRTFSQNKSSDRPLPGNRGIDPTDSGGIGH